MDPHKVRTGKTARVARSNGALCELLGLTSVSQETEGIWIFPWIENSLVNIVLHSGIGEPAT